MPAPRDEYSTYANQVWAAVLEGKSSDDIANMLFAIISDRMELRPNKRHDKKVAELVLEWAKLLEQVD